MLRALLGGRFCRALSGDLGLASCDQDLVERSIIGRKAGHQTRQREKEYKWLRKLSRALSEKSRETSTAFYPVYQKMVSEQ